MKRGIAALVLACAVAPAAPALAQAAEPTPADIEHFLRTADVVDAREAGKGSTRPWRLTLSDASMTHDALFQPIDTRSRLAVVGDQVVRNFADSYEFNIAAYRLAVLLGIGEMVPVTVERRWRREPGSLSWWVEADYDEESRIEADVEPSDRDAWRAEVRIMRVFSQLVHDTDRNQTNMLYTPDWRLAMIDFSRAFGRSSEIMNPDDLDRVDRDLFDHLTRVTDREIRNALDDCLTREELDALVDRRRKVVDQIERFITEQGDSRVLY